MYGGRVFSVVSSCGKKSCITSITRLAGLQILRNRSGFSYKHHIGVTPLKHVPLGVILNEAANKWPDRPAIISRYENKTLTYAELLQQSQKLSVCLRNLGMEKGDRLGIWLPNCTQWIVAMMAAGQCGLISVAINHLYGKRELEYALKKVGVKTLLAPGSRFNEKYYKILNEVIPELSTSEAGKLNSANFTELKSVILADDDKSSPGTMHYDKLLATASVADFNSIGREVHLINSDSACNIQYTSGTTGDPKAALLSHNNIINNGFAVGTRNELNVGHKKICVQVPLFHVFGVVITISASIQHGATMVFPSPTYSRKANLDTLLSERCDVIHGTPTMHIDLVNEVKSRGVAGLDTEIAVTGGSPVTPKLVKDMADTLGISKIKSVFGMSEATAVTFQSVPGEDPERPLHYLGHLHDHLEAKVVNENNELVPFGQSGELLTRGYSTMIGYWDDDKKTKETVGDDGWLRSGDQVVLHEDGYSQILGRLKDIIIRGGENIVPKEIEDVLSTHKDVLECQVFGVQDDRLGEDICAAVRLRDDATFDPDELVKHVTGHIAKYKVPRIIKRVESFPKTASGKIQKVKLRAMVEAGKL